MRYTVLDTKRYYETVAITPTHPEGSFEHHSRLDGTYAVGQIILDGMRRRDVLRLNRALKRGDAETADKIMSRYVTTTSDRPGVICFTGLSRAIVADPLEPGTGCTVGVREVHELAPTIEGELVDSTASHPFIDGQVIDVQATPLHIES